MDQPNSTIVDRGLDVLDGAHALVDVAFAHDLAVGFVDRGIHECATSITHALIELLLGLHEELRVVDSQGRMGALLAMAEPCCDALQELLLGVAHPMGTRPVFALLHLERPISRAFAHLAAVGRLGATTPITDAQRASLCAATEALLANLESFRELLQALDPVEVARSVQPMAAAPSE
ncbi:MAG: hypothetical protein K0V04_46100 [Deltaproteobacteria bacterium]|nr:hypothetical protein [Deltaproteobacteria bacterium]